MQRNRLAVGSVRKTARTTWGAVRLALLVAMLGGCSNSLKEQNVHLTEENEGLRAQLTERNTALESSRDELRERDARIAQLNRDLEQTRLAGDSARGKVAANTPADPFAGISGVRGSVGSGEIMATVESDVLFDSGKSVLKSTAKQSLDAVARVLREKYPGKTIRVSGHTDTDPIKKSGYKSNYHLGFERAYAVREYLISKGVPSKRVYVASHGPDQALANKKESRRVEIAVVLNE